MLGSEFPTVDGQLSVKCYHQAIEKCYKLLKEKHERAGNSEYNLDTVDYCCFHSPFCKMVYRSFITLLNIDLKYTPLAHSSAINGVISKGIAHYEVENLDERIQRSLQNLRGKDLKDKESANDFNQVLNGYWGSKTADSTLLRHSTWQYLYWITLLRTSLFGC